MASCCFSATVLEYSRRCLLSSISTAPPPPTKFNDKAKAVVDKHLKDHKVVLFGLSTCPYAKKAAAALKTYTFKPNAYIEYYWDQNPSSDYTVDEFKDIFYPITGARSSPRVFVDGKFLAGGDGTVEAHNNGKLKELLQAAGALA